VIVHRWIWISVAVLIPRALLAQPLTYDGCRDYRGEPVASVPEPTLGDLAMATIGTDGTPLIFYNPSSMQKLHAETRLFFYAHECAHHALAHLPELAISGEHAPAIEQEADCFGIRLLVHAGLVKDHDISVIQRELSHLGRGDWDHLPGPMRAINLRRCLVERREVAGSYCCAEQPVCALRQPAPIGAWCECPAANVRGRVCGGL